MSGHLLRFMTIRPFRAKLDILHVRCTKLQHSALFLLHRVVSASVDFIPADVIDYERSHSVCQVSANPLDASSIIRFAAGQMAASHA
uniref:ENTH domain-containing protein n=1 Tax=Steinernema glaseri TaxID=37863 RepID=A0A1I8AVJ6_9BILA